MSSNICFISNFYLTELYEEIATQLISKKFNVYWICPNKNTYYELSRKWGAENVLYIGMNSIINTPINELSHFGDLEDIASNDLLIRDRILKYQPKKGSHYLKTLKHVVFEFLKTNDIKAIFGELTWSHEVLINRICLKVSECNTTYLNPHTLRIPQETFGFFLDEFQSNLSNHKFKESEDYEMRKRYINAFIDKNDDLPTPDYLKLNDRIIKKENSFSAQLLKLYRLLFKKTDLDDPDDPTTDNSKLRRFFNGSIRFINTLNYSLIKKDNITAIAGKKYYLYPLHKQPEASIDVIGKYYDDQLINIKNIASQLKDDEFLVIKEHTNAIGDRSLFFYKKISKFPRVMLIDEKIDTKLLIKSSSGVFTVSGTVALEASLMSKSNFCFSEVYFKSLKHCHLISINDFNRNKIFSKKKESLKNEEFIELILESACDGIISNPKSDIRCINPNNIKKLAKEFYAVIRSL